MRRILALDGASAGGAGFGLVEDRADGLHPVLDRREDGQGAAVRLPGAIAAALRDAGWDRGRLDLIAVLVGPGSFTGLRASLALAHGMALGAGSSVVGVTVGEALADALGAAGAKEPVWCASQARRDRVFIEMVAPDGAVGAPVAHDLPALPDPDGVVMLAGDAQAVVGAVLASRGLFWTPGPSRPSPGNIARAALRRLHGTLAPLAAQPLYVDPPEARPQNGGLPPSS